VWPSVLVRAVVVSGQWGEGVGVAGTQALERSVSRAGTARPRHGAYLPDRGPEDDDVLAQTGMQHLARGERRAEGGGGGRGAGHGPARLRSRSRGMHHSARWRTVIEPMAPPALLKSHSMSSTGPWVMCFGYRTVRRSDDDTGARGQGGGGVPLCGLSFGLVLRGVGGDRQRATD
jgi:hypothetical protein